MSKSIPQEFYDYLKKDYSKIMDMGDGLWCGSHRLIFHWTLHIGQIGDFCTYLDRYCYRDQKLCEDAMDEWKSRNFSGDPINWHRHPGTGRRRENGDSKLETLDDENGITPPRAF